MSSSELSAYYQQLHLPADATLQNVDEAYFRLRAQKIKEDARQEVTALKLARDKVKAHLQAIEQPLAILPEKSPSPQTSPSSDAKITSVETLTATLKQLGLATQIRFKEKTLHIGIAILSVYLFIFLKNRNHLYLYALWQNRRLKQSVQAKRSLR